MPSTVAASAADRFAARALRLVRAALAVHVAPETRRRALCRAQEYMHAHARERVSLAELCFWHMGHLARYYRSLFGEAPSETLSRSGVATDV